MINSNIHESLAEAYIEGLQDLLEHGKHAPSVTEPTSAASNFGKGDRPAIELLGYSFQVNNPFSSLFLSDARIIRVPYCIGLFLWTVTGSNRVDWLSYYNPVAYQFSDDGTHLCGAFGKRLFDYNDTINQIDAICARLTHDPATRRALGVICTPEDNVTTSREYPCCIGVQYFLRDGALHAITHMRAQQALTVLPFDAFIFMALQCLLASRLGVKVGYYKHIAGTFHIYEAEVAQAKQVISTGAMPVQIGDMSNPKTNMEELLVFERQLRQATINRDIDRIEQIAAQEIRSVSFFEQVKAILLLHSLLTLKLHEKLPNILKNMKSPLKDLAEKYMVVAK
jgi:thymidylate synthase